MVTSWLHLTHSKRKQYTMKNAINSISHTIDHTFFIIGQNFFELHYFRNEFHQNSLCHILMHTYYEKD